MNLFDTRHAFMSAYLKGEEAKIVTSEHINRMSKVSSVPDAIEIIRETDIGNYLEEALIKAFDDVDEYLWRYFDGCLKHLEWFKPVPGDILKILKAYIVKYDVLNIKAALQGISTGKEARSIPVGIIHNYGLLDELFSVEDVDGIIAILNRYKPLGDYASVLEKNKVDGGVKSSLLFQASLDNVYYENLLNAARGVDDGSILVNVFSVLIDMANLRIIDRAIINGMGVEAAESVIAGGNVISGEVAKELLALQLADVAARLEGTPYHTAAEEIARNYSSTKSITVVDEIIDKHQFRLTREILAPRVLSPLVIAWYLIIKEIEIRNLRLILKAMFDNISLEEIKMYLVLPS